MQFETGSRMTPAEWEQWMAMIRLMGVSPVEVARLIHAEDHDE